jgi:hypothetical protein
MCAAQIRNQPALIYVQLRGDGEDGGAASATMRIFPQQGHVENAWEGDSVGRVGTFSYALDYVCLFDIADSFYLFIFSLEICLTGEICINIVSLVTLYPVYCNFCGHGLKVQ